jgi:hypothetical protein
MATILLRGRHTPAMNKQNYNMRASALGDNPVASG